VPSRPQSALGGVAAGAPDPLAPGLPVDPAPLVSPGFGVPVSPLPKPPEGVAEALCVAAGAPDPLCLLGDLLLRPRMMGISAASPVTMAATPVINPGMVLQKDFLSAMVELLSLQAVVVPPAARCTRSGRPLVRAAA